MFRNVQDFQNMFRVGVESGMQNSISNTFNSVCSILKVGIPLNINLKLGVEKYLLQPADFSLGQFRILDNKTYFLLKLSFLRGIFNNYKSNFFIRIIVVRRSHC